MLDSRCRSPVDVGCCPCSGNEPGHVNICRQDGKDSLKFYTEPGYFFELWCQAMQKDAARNQQKRQRKGRRAPVSIVLCSHCLSETTVHSVTVIRALACNGRSSIMGLMPAI